MQRILVGIHFEFLFASGFAVTSYSTTWSLANTFSLRNLLSTYPLHTWIFWKWFKSRDGSTL